MIAEAIRLLDGCNRWATERILDAAERLSSDQLVASSRAGHGSVRDTLVHLIETQWGWLSWFNGSLSAADAIRLRIDRANVPNVAAIRAHWNDIDRQTHEFIAGLTDEDLKREMPMPFPGGNEVSLPLWGLLLHVVNHGTQHRSEVAAMLSEHGHSPGNLDVLFYMLDSGAGSGVATGRLRRVTDGDS